MSDLKSLGMTKCAALVRGDMLAKIYKKCEYQQTVTTKKLEKMVDELAERLKVHAIYTKKLLDRIQELEERCKELENTK